MNDSELDPELDAEVEAIFAEWERDHNALQAILQTIEEHRYASHAGPVVEKIAKVIDSWWQASWEGNDASKST